MYNNHASYSKVFTSNKILHLIFSVEKGNDIALLKLKSPFTFNSKVRPVCIPTSAQDIPPTSQAITTGWGTLGKLRFFLLKIY